MCYTLNKIEYLLNKEANWKIHIDVNFPDNIICKFIKKTRSTYLKNIQSVLECFLNLFLHITNNNHELQM